MLTVFTIFEVRAILSCSENSVSTIFLG